MIKDKISQNVAFSRRLKNKTNQNQSSFLLWFISYCMPQRWTEPTCHACDRASKKTRPSCPAHRNKETSFSHLLAPDLLLQGICENRNNKSQLLVSIFTSKDSCEPQAKRLVQNMDSKNKCKKIKYYTSSTQLN